MGLTVGSSSVRCILFLIFINDIDDEVKPLIDKFADDTKVAQIVNTDQDKYSKPALIILSNGLRTGVLSLIFPNVRFYMLAKTIIITSIT